uniref:Uncharacterized protein n=1 Tax=viral metagenome TaxID=1070528 RepID=A0A6M3IGC7_9ZZZZ
MDEMIELAERAWARAIYKSVMPQKEFDFDRVISAPEVKAKKMDGNFRGWIDATRYPVVTGTILGDFKDSPSIVESTFTLGELIPGKIEGFWLVEDVGADALVGS